MDITYDFFLTAFFLVLGLGAAAIFIGEARLGTRREGRTRVQKAGLLARAQFDRSAAKQLRRLLVRELRAQQAVRRDLEDDRAKSGERAGLLRDLERSEQVTRDELARVEVWLQRDR